jgi:hypothetical protein
MFELFKRIKKMFDPDDLASVVRQAVSDLEVQSQLFEPENKKYLKAFISYGHKFHSLFEDKFIAQGDKDLVALYVEQGHNISEKGKELLVNRKDDSLTRKLLSSMNWVPFPLGGSCFNHPLHTRERLEIELDAL